MVNVQFFDLENELQKEMQFNESLIPVLKDSHLLQQFRIIF